MLAMPKNSRGLFIAAAALAAVCHFRKPAFVPSPARRTASVVLPAAAVAAASAPAFADSIGDAAKVLAKEAYPFMKEVPWNSFVPLLPPGSAPAGEWAKAVDKAIVMGASMDPALLKAGVKAHHAAVLGVSEGSPVLSEADFATINAALGRMIASVPESQTMDVYNAFSALVNPSVPPYLMSQVNEADAKKAYAALMTFKDVVKANPIKPTPVSTPAALSSKLGAIDTAAAKLSSASYPMIKSIPWDSDVFTKPLPGVSAGQALKAIDKALMMGAAMDSKLLQDAAMAHHKALGSMDAKLVTTEADYTAVNAALGKLIASVPQPQVMDVYNSFAKITNPSVPNLLYSKVDPAAAQAAYTALLGFKDVVKAAQR